MKQYYTICQGRSQEGPFDEQFVKEQYTTGAYEEDTYVWTEGMKDWLPIATVFPPEKLQKTPPHTPPPFVQKASPPALPKQDNQDERIPEGAQTTCQRLRPEKKKTSVGCLLGAIIGTIFIIFGICGLFSSFDTTSGKGAGGRGLGEILKIAAFTVAGCYYMWKYALKKK